MSKSLSRAVLFFVLSLILIPLSFQNCTSGFSAQSLGADPTIASLGLASTGANNFAAGNASSACIASGNESAINSALASGGAGAVISLCPGAVFNLQAPVQFTANGQEISTQGYPTDNSMAQLIVQGNGQATAIAGAGFSDIKLKNLIVNGNRGSGPKSDTGGALIEIGGYASGQVVDHIWSFDPRGWSALHITEGDIAGGRHCPGAQITSNKIGPAGHGGDKTWADGISMACTSSVVTNNFVQDASDGGIVIFGAPGTQVTNNTVQTNSNILLGGINLVDYAPYNGNYNGTVVANNIINAAGGFIKIGIAIGPTVWGMQGGPSVGGTVNGNIFQGPRMGYGIAADGIDHFTILNNNFPGATYSGVVGASCPAGNLPPQALLINGATATSSNLQPGFDNGQAHFVICIDPPAGNANPPPAAPICSASTQPAPEWGAKNGQCLKSCGALGGTASFSDTCSAHGMLDAGAAYDVGYCCKAAPLPELPNSCWMNSGVQFAAGQGVKSYGGAYTLIVQYDGNVVLYGPSGALWATNTGGQQISVLAMQSDGNLVLYSSSGAVLWASNTGGHPGARLAVQDDGNLVIYGSSGEVLWARK